ncbi:MAG: Hpt domain-containing protein [Pseudomonadota bacterium]
MGMALKKDVLAACRNAGTEKPVDLVHLSSITMGDRGLEQEILSMFSAQIPGYLEMAEGCEKEADVRRVAHTIKGSARSIGAFRLAEFAKTCEESCQIDLTALKNEFDIIADYISSLQ